MTRNFNDRVMALGALVAAATAIGGVIFTAGDASQRLKDTSQRTLKLEDRATRIENAQGDMRVTLAILSAQMNDVQETVHRVDGTPVPRKR